MVRFRRGEVHPGHIRQPRVQLRKVSFRNGWFSFETLRINEWFTFCDFEDESVEWLIGTIREFVIHGFVSHVLAKNSGIGGESTDGHADVVVDFKHFLLVA